MPGLSRVNDFVVKFANVNGSGSASANRLFAKSILRMGVPAAPRNIFPSNIQGLPTWYEVRVSGAGWLGARGGTDLMVAMNPQTWDKDVAGIEPGGFLFYNSTRPVPPEKLRSDITVIGMPLTAICNAEYTDPRQRQLFKNIIYVGALAALLDMELPVIEQLLREQFKDKQKLIDANLHALHLGHDASPASSMNARSGCASQRMDAVGDRIFIDGNSAAALGCVYGGATVAAWYPITPSSSMAEAFSRYCARYRVDKETGEQRYAIIQAEDELASIGMVIGAGWNGARAFTATSGPGISLMQEFIGLAYFAEIPAVIFDVQRGGPSTGMPTRTQQSDVLSCAYASHGDTKHVLLFPEDPHECFEMAVAALDLAERLQTPVFVLLDLDIGMNERLTAPFAWDDTTRMDRGKVMTAAELEAGKRFRPLSRCGWRRHSISHLSRHACRARRLLHPRHSKDRYARYTEEGGAVCRQHGAAAAQVRHGEAGWCPRRCAAMRRERARARRDLLRLHRPGDGGGDRRCWRHGASRSTSSASAPSRSATRCVPGSPRMSACSWSSRTGTRSSARCWSRRARSIRRSSSASCTITARRSRRASSPTRSASMSMRARLSRCERPPHDLSRQAQAASSEPADQCARIDAARL